METTLKTNEIITAEEALAISKTKSWLPEVFAAIREAAERGQTFTSWSELESHDKVNLIALGYRVRSKAGNTYINWGEM
ncbi:MAG: hypothetical protein ACRC3Z_13210 [Phocaeicola sp.]